MTDHTWAYADTNRFVWHWYICRAYRSTADRDAWFATFCRSTAEVADSPDSRQTGLMFRPRLGPNEGMLFVFPEKSPQCFWMKNTQLPLTIAFIADDGTIVNLADMKPQTLDSHCSDKPVRFVLEMNQGWFAKKNIKAGFKLAGPPFQGK